MIRQGPNGILLRDGSADKVKHLRLWCLGRSTKPIESLLQEAVRAFTQEIELDCTEIYVNTNQTSWLYAAVRPRRPIETVDLDYHLKKHLLDDIALFREPKTKKWYKHIGVPYRRGYLFQGAPGTGKTSLAFAIAGKFGLQIHSLSLSDRSLRDKDLPNLFSNLGPRALLLLEDIDSAGLSRESQIDNRAEEPKAGEHTGDTSNDSEKKVSAPSPKSNITLSGVLNAIDGVGAPEGHILVMTSNKPQSLDPALVRAGGVDYSVEFTLASKGQAESIFKRMYNYKDEEDEACNTVSHLSDDELARLAKDFADKIPAGLFSPADIQDYIIFRRFEPQRAIDEVEHWVKEKRAENEKKEKGAEGSEDDHEAFYDVA